MPHQITNTPGFQELHSLQFDCQQQQDHASAPHFLCMSPSPMPAGLHLGSAGEPVGWVTGEREASQTPGAQTADIHPEMLDQALGFWAQRKSILGRSI